MVLLALTAAAVTQAVVQQKDGLVVHFDAEFSPHSLPRQSAAPIKVTIKGAVATTDGTHPPPLKVLEIKLNHNGRIYTRGLPSCAPSRLQSTSTSEARARCGSALVGRGKFQAEVELGTNNPVAAGGEVLAFNGRVAGKPGLLLHFFGGAPVRFTLVVPLRIGNHRDGEFGPVLRTRIPKLANGFGSITQIELSLGRRWRFAGKPRSYLSAACSAPA
ncbi:MAG: hypothetical protein ACTHNY_06580, partial [Solirubrobacterales bacterium]